MAPVLVKKVESASRNAAATLAAFDGVNRGHYF
jgi:hypothetical protein